MEPFFNVADHYTRTALGGRATSALPNAPVLPVDDRRTLRMRWSAILRRDRRRPRLEIRAAQYRPGCSPP
jgi:hypothetical protein